MLAELQFRRLVIVSNEFWDAALLNAAWCGWTDMVKHLISRGASLEWPEHEYLKSPLYRACRYGHEGVVRVLLDNGAEPFRPDFETAATHGHFSTLKLLLEIQPVFQPSLTKNCLYAAARKGFLAIVRLLLDFGADPNGGETAPLIGAVEAEHVIIFRLLVQWGADVPSVQAEASKRAEAAGLESMLALLNENHVI
ncbi:ankyrin [Ophiobolus disseminans]|uniref:Ankyrin n=1 Tax=Ophiobolus disseminans TaxID=1469910 RepID=A0A6A6ZSS1_9PLEO|nr:ankyrin [Ophiobolus disseminans]